VQGDKIGKEHQNITGGNGPCQKLVRHQKKKDDQRHAVDHLKYIPFIDAGVGEDDFYLLGILLAALQLGVDILLRPQRLDRQNISSAFDILPAGSFAHAVELVAELFKLAVEDILDREKQRRVGRQEQQEYRAQKKEYRQHADKRRRHRENIVVGQVHPLRYGEAAGEDPLYPVAAAFPCMPLQGEIHQPLEALDARRCLRGDADAGQHALARQADDGDEDAGEAEADRINVKHLQRIPGAVVREEVDDFSHRERRHQVKKQHAEKHHIQRDILEFVRAEKVPDGFRHIQP